MLIGLFGTGRNGSSLIGRLLDGLQDTYVHPVEENFLAKFDDLCRYGKVQRLTSQNCVSRPLRHIAGRLSVDMLQRAYGESVDELHDTYITLCDITRQLGKPNLRRLLPEGHYGVEDFVRSYLSTLARYLRPDIEFQHYLFKSIETPYVLEYANRFPEMKFIHIVRDPIAVSSSQKRSLLENKKLPAHYLGYDWLACMLNKRWLPHARFIVEHRDDARHVVVRYEDLVADPKATIDRISALLGLAPPPRPDIQTVFYDQENTDWGFNPSKAGARTPREVVSDLQKKLGYQEVLTQREVDLINYKTSAYQKEFGYTPSTQPSLRRVLRQYAAFDRWEFAHTRGFGGWLRCLVGVAYRRISII